MFSQLKAFTKSRLPFLVPIWRQIVTKSPSQVFTGIYRENKWGDEHSRSGPGSNLDQTEVVRKILPLLIEELNCRSLLDIPCGDFFWMKLIELDTQYIGGDIVADLIKKNKREYSSKKRKFVHMNIIHGHLPKVDLILCRDCLVHFPYFHALRALKNIKRSGSTYLLTTTFVGRDRNEDNPFGAWYPINLLLPPFSLPSPMRLINEECPLNGIGDKCLGLWKTTDIPDFS